MALLDIDDISKSFGGVSAVSRVSFQVQGQEIVAVIGPNGAGKTTLFNMITGVISPSQGSIRFKGKVVSGLKPHQISALGISRTFQNVELFGNMSVRETIMVGADAFRKTGFMHSLLGSPREKREELFSEEIAKEKLALVGLHNREMDDPSELPCGQQRLVEIARALAISPVLLLLDEPAAGLNEYETETLAELILRLRESGLTVLLVEHDMEIVMKVADRIVVLDYGKKIAEGAPAAIQCDQAVITAYLGEEVG